ncbi:alpha/beta fold hydrolase [Nocardia sp. NBC_01503]|uniref:alpha/beta fold hydrolase n=1 Tax=Nocardia sp. NBC_01503 TaxID=2975997 RepID=UPI002E7B67F3|nr:alpha/beta fold hydrolase [Nocardia sp. NBC_01503]WTL35511.1 alpha/beta fold hydrolase [Nocardia sp. NBC_01503]
MPIDDIHSRNHIQHKNERGRRRWRIALFASALLLALLAGNTVSVCRSTADASGDQIVRLPGGDLHIAQSGPAGAPAIVLLHGLGGSTAWWEPILPALSDMRVIRIDLLGHGSSAKPTDGYGISEQARRIGAALDQLGVRRATLVGHSTGGMVATALAEERRDLVEAIALVDTGPRVDAFAGDSAAGKLLFTPVIGELAWQLRTDGLIRDALSSAFTREVHIPEQIVADVRGMTYRAFTATSDGGNAYLTARQLPDRLTDLGLPILVIFGSRDKRWQPSSFQDYGRVPGVRIEELAGVGHTPMFEDTEVTGALIHGFAADRSER